MLKVRYQEKMLIDIMKEQVDSRDLNEIPAEVIDMCCATFANKNGQHSDIFEIIKAIVKDNFKVEDYNFILKRV